MHCNGSVQDCEYILHEGFTDFSISSEEKVLKMRVACYHLFKCAMLKNDFLWLYTPYKKNFYVAVKCGEY